MNVNYWAILAAAVASFLFGGMWYAAFSKLWLGALGKSEAELKASTRPLPALLGLSLIGVSIMAWVLAGLIVHLAKAGVPANLRTGVITAAICWLGFVATTVVTNYAYQGRKARLALIDGGHWLGVLLLQGALLGWLGVR